MFCAKLATWVGILALVWAWGLTEPSSQRVEARTVLLLKRCKRKCKRVYKKHSTRRCKRRWSCGSQYECRWVRYQRLDHDGNRRSYQKRQCSYVRRCSHKLVCVYRTWSLKCSTECAARKRLPGVLLAVKKQKATLAALNTCGMFGEELELFSQVNLARMRHKRKPLKCLASLNKAAQQWSQVQCFRGELSHSRLRQRLSEAGVPAKIYAENVAAGLRSAVYVFRRWMRSRRHRSYILHKAFTHYGGGLFLCGTSKHTHYWTQLFVRR